MRGDQADVARQELIVHNFILQCRSLKISSLNVEKGKGLHIWNILNFMCVLPVWDKNSETVGFVGSASYGGNKQLWVIMSSWLQAVSESFRS